MSCRAAAVLRASCATVVRNRHVTVRFVSCHRGWLCQQQKQKQTGLDKQGKTHGSILEDVLADAQSVPQTATEKGMYEICGFVPWVSLGLLGKMFRGKI